MLVYDDVPEEVLFSGAHQLQAGDRIKFVPASQGSCDGYSSPDFGGTVGPGKDGWGKTVVTVRLFAFESPYALCTMEKTKGEKSFRFHGHVLMNVNFAPSPPPMPPAAPPPFGVLQLLPHFGMPSVPEMSTMFEGTFRVLGTIAMAMGGCLALYVCCACMCVYRHMDPFRFQRLEEKPPPATPAPPTAADPEVALAA